MAKTLRSEAQRAASRANGRKSTGPRTEAGKSRTRCNALKHGLRAASLDILPSDVDATPLVLANAVRDRLAPADVVEAELAEGIALAYWRLRRARQLEEMLVEGRPNAVAPNTLARFLLRRSNAIDALGLVLRYRNQALGELARLGRLLDQHRRLPAPAAAGSPDPTLLPTGVSATSTAADGSLRAGRRHPANDNLRAGTEPTAAEEESRPTAESDPACLLPADGQKPVDPTPGSGSTVN